MLETYSYRRDIHHTMVHTTMQNFRLKLLLRLLVQCSFFYIFNTYCFMPYRCFPKGRSISVSKSNSLIRILDNNLQPCTLPPEYEILIMLQSHLSFLNNVFTAETCFSGRKRGTDSMKRQSLVLCTEKQVYNYTFIHIFFIRIKANGV